MQSAQFGTKLLIILALYDVKFIRMIMIIGASWCLISSGLTVPWWLDDGDQQWVLAGKFVTGKSFVVVSCWWLVDIGSPEVMVVTY